MLPGPYQSPVAAVPVLGMVRGEGVSVTRGRSNGLLPALPPQSQAHGDPSLFPLQLQPHL